MCRFVVYKGSRLFLADLVTRPENSLIKQSYDAKLRPEPLNGDGFGVGWYSPEINQLPCVFTSLTPAWSNRNLRRLAEKIISPCIFAHVRAATPGMLVSETNCHPFHYGRYLWMHNGGIRDFAKIKRRLRESLRDDLYNFIEGTTDSEHAFAVFLNLLTDPLVDYSPQELAQVMKKTIGQLNSWSLEAGITGPSYYNFALTDGDCVITTRFVSDSTRQAPSLYYSHGAKYECENGVCRMVRAEEHEHAVVIASEPLTAFGEQWVEVPKNNLMLVTPDLRISLEPIEA